MSDAADTHHEIIEFSASSIAKAMEEATTRAQAEELGMGFFSLIVNDVMFDPACGDVYDLDSVIAERAEKLYASLTHGMSFKTAVERAGAREASAKAIALDETAVK